MKDPTAQNVAADTVATVRHNQDDVITGMSDVDLLGLVFRICNYILIGVGSKPERDNTNIIVITSFIEVMMKEYGGQLDLCQMGELEDVCSSLGLNAREIAQRFRP